jgi:SanA protein
MIIKILKFLLRITLLIGIIVILILGLPTLIAEIYGRNRIYSLEEVPSMPVAIVFGAGLSRDGTPSPVLRDRVATAAQLYFQGKVQKLLMSGDNRFIDYNEPGAMHAYALSLGVPEDAIVLDYAGRRTYDTCYRARDIFGLSQAVLVSQDYHLPRALMTCNGLGIKSVGVSADQQLYNSSSQKYWRVREIPATLVAFFDVFITRPLPVLGEPEPIIVEEIIN